MRIPTRTIQALIALALLPGCNDDGAQVRDLEAEIAEVKELGVAEVKAVSRRFDQIHLESKRLEDAREQASIEIAGLRESVAERVDQEHEKIAQANEAIAATKLDLEQIMKFLQEEMEKRERGEPVPRTLGNDFDAIGQLERYLEKLKRENSKSERTIEHLKNLDAQMAAIHFGKESSVE